jgi:RNA polymerase sigma-70 factor (ECF subfamily)
MRYHRFMSAEKDAELLEAWRGGDKRAGEQLFDRHADSVTCFFENKIGDGPEDLVQTTFLRMVESRERVRAGVAFRAFVLGIARNVLLRHLRDLARRPKFDPEVESMADLAPGPITIVDCRQEQRLLLEGLRRLPLTDQMFLELFYWEKLKTHEIAEILEISPSTARGRLAAARVSLGRRMAEIAESPELLASTMHGLDTWADELRARLQGRQNEPQASCPRKNRKISNNF